MGLDSAPEVAYQKGVGEEEEARSRRPTMTKKAKLIALGVGISVAIVLAVIVALATAGGDSESRLQEERHAAMAKHITELRSIVCDMPPETGPCRAHFSMFHFVPETGVCSQFVYGGCAGNGNKFDSEEECMAICGNDAPDTSKCPDTFVNHETGLCTLTEEIIEQERERKRNACPPGVLPNANGKCDL